MKKSNLVTKREALGLSRYSVSKTTGIHYDTLARIENPEVPTIPRSHIRTLIDFYRGHDTELTLEDLLA